MKACCGSGSWHYPLWLGHERSQTDHGYVEADLARKQPVLEQATPAGPKVWRFKAKDALLRFLTTH